MITNVESLVGKVRKERYQHNMQVDFQTADLDFYLTSRQPDPGLGDAEPYNESEILPAPVDNDPRQIIIHETASSTDAVATEYRKLRTQRHNLLQEYRSDLRRYWNILMGSQKIKKVFYKPTEKRIWLPAKRIKRRDGFKTVKTVVTLKPRQVKRPHTEVVLVRRRSGVVFRSTRVAYHLEWFAPQVTRFARRPKFREILLRAAGYYTRRVRTRAVVEVRDWVTIRRKYAAYKQGLAAALRARLASVETRLAELRHKVEQRPPRCMVSWTTHGFVRPYQPGESRRTDYQVNGVDRRDTTVYYPDDEQEYYPAPPWTKDRYTAFVFHSPGYGPIADQGAPPVVTEAQRAWFEREHHLPSGGDVLTVPRLRRGQGDLRFTERPSLEKQAMLAYSTVQSLTKARDYQFQWFRSLVELKDTKQSLHTLRQVSKAGSGFLTWVAGIQRMSLAQKGSLRSKLQLLSKKFGSTVRLLAAAYLTYKFAVEPTMADVDTVVKSTTDWLFEVRRALSSILTDPNRYLNTFHARAKYGDSVRELKLGRDVDLRVDDRTLEVSVPCTIRWPSFIWRTVGNYPNFSDGDSTFTAGLEVPYDLPLDETWVYPQATRAIRLTADSGFFELPYSVDGLACGGEWRRHPFGPFDVYVRHIDGAVRSSHSTKEVEEWILRKTFADSPVVERVPTYISTYSSGVVFGEYHLDDLLELLSRPGSSSPAVGGLMYSVYTGVCDMLSRLDTVKTAWELTPLSFVYDWFTDSSLLVTTLANLSRSNWTVYNQVPQPINGVWESRRTELLAGTGMYQFAGCECLEYIGSSPIVADPVNWTWSGMLPCLRPVLSHRRYRLRFEATNDKVRLMRTGLYRVRRGEQTGYAGIASYLPKVSVSVTGGKILSLSALITSLLGGNGR